MKPRWVSPVAWLPPHGEGFPTPARTRTPRLPEHETAKEPQVWHRDQRRPSFARVYVGDGNALELVSLQVTVTVEGPRARTVVDHIFRNPHDRQLEGTFEYRCDRRQPSYFAMFIGSSRTPCRRASAGRATHHPAAERPGPADARGIGQAGEHRRLGNLQEARVVSKEKHWRRTRRSSAAGSTPPCSNTRAATPSAAASSHSAERLQPRPYRLRGSAAVRAGPRGLPLPVAGLQAGRAAIHAQRQRSGVQAAGLPP